jgi:hypothetical protein
LPEISKLAIAEFLKKSFEEYNRQEHKAPDPQDYPKHLRYDNCKTSMDYPSKVMSEFLEIAIR